MNIHMIKKLVIGAVPALFSLAVSAGEPEIVEWAPFNTQSSVTKLQVIEAADRVNSEFLAKQTGFIKRQLIQKSVHEFADIVHWKSAEDAENAAVKVADCQPCQAYFSLMDASATEAGGGFAHYRQLKSW